MTDRRGGATEADAGRRGWATGGAPHGDASRVDGGRRTLAGSSQIGEKFGHFVSILSYLSVIYLCVLAV